MPEDCWPWMPLTRLDQSIIGTGRSSKTLDHQISQFLCEEIPGWLWKPLVSPHHQCWRRGWTRSPPWSSPQLWSSWQHLQRTCCCSTILIAPPVWEEEPLLSHNSLRGRGRWWKTNCRHLWGDRRLTLPGDLVSRWSRRDWSSPSVEGMVCTFSRMSVKHVIRLTFGGVGGLLVPPFVEAHGHLVQLLAKLPSWVLLKLHPGVPELDVRVETIRLQVPANGGLEVGQLVRVEVEQALKLVRPHLSFRPHEVGGRTGSLDGAHPVRACRGTQKRWRPPRRSRGTQRRWHPPRRSRGTQRGWRWNCGDRVFQRPRAPCPEGLPHSWGYRWTCGGHVFQRSWYPRPKGLPPYRESP